MAWLPGYGGPRKKEIECDRCGLYKEFDKRVCVHCGDLSEQELKKLALIKLQEDEAHSKVGRWMFGLSIAIAILLMALNI